MKRLRGSKGLGPIAAAAAVLVLSANAPAQTSTCYDTIIDGGTLFDGTGREGHSADVAIVADRIAVVGDLRDACSTRRIDARGLYVSPGFINVHDHSEIDALPASENMLTQGVTTAIVNADGSGPTDIRAQLAEYQAVGPAINVGASIGFNSAWQAVMGNANRRPSPAEIGKMQNLVLKGLADGAWAVSSGLDYKPGYFAKAAEVAAVLRPAAKWRTNFPNHDRLTPDTGWSSITGVRETVEIANQAGIIPVITHMKVQGNEQGRAKEAIALIDASIAGGRYAAADVYPYLAGQTSLGALILPPWALEGGREATKARFSDPSLRARIAAEAERTMDARWGGAKGVYIIRTGQELTEVMRTHHVSAGEAVIRTLEDGDTGAILRFGAERDLVAIMKQPTAAISCDCGASNRTLHPRWAGTFPKVLGHYVRETGTLTWQDAIRKMTGLPATLIGMIDRGFLAPGMIADIAIFDPRSIADRATYDNPQALSIGMRYVFVNGKAALADGRLTGVRAGAALARASDMPSRRETTSAARSLRFSARLQASGDQAATGKTVEATVAVHQNPSDAFASGSIRLHGPDGYRLEIARFGILQSADGWASVSAIAKTADGKQHAVTITADHANPLATNGKARFTVAVDGHNLFASWLTPRDAELAIKQDFAVQ